MSNDNQSERIDDDDDDDDGMKFDFDALQKRIDKQTNQYYDFFLKDDETTSEASQLEKKQSLRNVYIIVFNQEEDEEGGGGIHTIEYPKGQNTILAFESQEECQRFAQMLKDMQFFDPIVEEIGYPELESYVVGTMGVPVKVVYEGQDLTPPPDQVDELTINPNTPRQRKELDSIWNTSNDDDNDDSSDILSDSSTLNDETFDDNDMDSWQ